MRFTVSSSALSSKLNMLAKVIGSKNSLPILDCFLFQVANGEMSITASDSDNVIKSTLALTDHDGEGEFCVPNRVILDALKELPEQPLHFDVDTAGEAVAIKIVYQNGLYNFTGQSAEEYPRTQSMNDACTTVSLPTEMLINNISRSLFATANDELAALACKWQYAAQSTLQASAVYCNLVTSSVLTLTPLLVLWAECSQVRFLQ
jgi:DNA polymerase III subunit beta